jgi:hypothetical protein
MRKARFTEEQMVAIIREADRDQVSAVAKRHGVSEQTEPRPVLRLASCCAGLPGCACCRAYVQSSLLPVTKQWRPDMGLKEWLAKNVAGVSGYGSTMGLEVVKNGRALGRTLYLGHGTRAMASGAVVFENQAEMLAAGFSAYCADPASVYDDPASTPPMEDASNLSRHLRALGISFAAACSFRAAHVVMKKANATSFSQSMFRSMSGRLSSGITPDLLTDYMGIEHECLLNLEKPGTNDTLFAWLEHAVNKSGAGAIGFQRSGPLGFAAYAVPLVTETWGSVNAATQRFGW